MTVQQTKLNLPAIAHICCNENPELFNLLCLFFFGLRGGGGGGGEGGEGAGGYFVSDENRGHISFVFVFCSYINVIKIQILFHLFKSFGVFCNENFY